MQDTIDDIIKSHDRLKLHDANEAETRMKLIDRLIYEILNWKQDDVSYEERVTEDNMNTFADYILRTANIALLIEAKRIGHTFTSISTQKKFKLTNQIMNSDCGEAIRQARDYCRKKSIQFAAVTNGSQWILFPAFRNDQVSFESSTAIFFDSIHSFLGADFDYFSSLLSRDGVINGVLEYELLGRTEDQIEERRLKTFFKSNHLPPPNPIYPLIQNEINLAFTESISDVDNYELLSQCYIPTADRKRFDSRIKMHISRHEALFIKQTKKPMRKQSANSMNEIIQKARVSSRPLAILLLGPVGAGKTTFLKYTYYISMRDYFNKTDTNYYPHWIEIDFRDYTLDKTPQDFICESILEYMKNDQFFSDYKRSIKNAYNDEINFLKSGPMNLVTDEQNFNNKITEIIYEDYKRGTPYIEKLLTYSLTKSPCFIVIDNVDQIDSEQFQGRIFSDAIAFSSKLKINLILSLRESTFVKYRATSIFDAYDYEPVQIEPPEIIQVLAKRFRITQQLLSGKSGEFTALNGARFDVSDLSIFIDLVRESVLGTEVGKKIEVLANGDVRLSLRITREFLERGYTDPAKALENYNNNNAYVLPKHEAFRAILLGNQSVYSEEFSVIGNPFDSRLNKTNAQLLRFFLLAALVKLSSDAAFEYMDGVTIKERFRAIGFNDNYTQKILTDLCKLRFIHTASHGVPNFNCNYYPSKLGGYIIRDLMADFTFLENTLMDTFIFSNEKWEQLKLLSENIRDERNTINKLTFRVSRLKIFYQYMKELYSSILSEAQKRNLPFEWCSNPFEEMENQFYSKCTKALESAKRHY